MASWEKKESRGSYFTKKMVTAFQVKNSIARKKENNNNNTQNLRVKL